MPLRPWLVGAAGAMVALFVFLAVTAPPVWWWAMAALNAALLGFFLSWPRRFQRRAAILQDGVPDDR